MNSEERLIKRWMSKLRKKLKKYGFVIGKSPHKTGERFEVDCLKNGQPVGTLWTTPRRIGYKLPEGTHSTSIANPAGIEKLIETFHNQLIGKVIQGD